MVAPWIHLDDVEDSAPMITALKQAGIVLRNEARREGPGIVVAKRVDDMSIDVVRGLKAHGETRLLVILTDELAPTPERVLELRRAGAGDVVSWVRSATCADAIKARLERWEAVDGLLDAELATGRIIARDRALREMLREIIEVAAFTTDPIVLLGQSGTGKEEVARLIHRVDRRTGKADLVVLDCTTIAPELAASEFFGHERGAFTGALAPRDGAFALADGGTLFLDEVGELPLTMQAQLLRVVQEKKFKRVGGNDWHQTDFRLVCATNRDLDQETPERPFRRDFYHRIARWVFRLPCLAERWGDIVPLAEHFVGLYLGQNPGLDPAVCTHLCARSYPGNVRDLRNLVARLCGRHVGPGPISFGDVPRLDFPAGDVRATDTLDQAVRRALLSGLGLKEVKRQVREAAVHAALESAGGNVAAAARLLQISDRALQMELAKRDDG